VAQSLRPFPQFGTISALGVPLGESKYDSLQVKANKRYSHGLNLTATFTWQNERTNILPGNNQFFNDPVDRFYVSDLSEPLISVVAFSYQVPAFTSNRIVRAVVGGWTFGGMVRYATGMPIPVPASQNQLNALLFQNTRMNRVEGEPLYVINRGQGDPLPIDDLNSDDIEPSADFVLNPRAWANPPAGQFGSSLPYYDDFRYQRRPDEQLSIGRSFNLKNRARLEIRGEFFNAFNRIQLNNPDAGNPLQTQTRNPQGVTTAGFGRINTGTVFGPPRSGQIVSRLSW
jgi:hypothetical protein